MFKDLIRKRLLTAVLTAVGGAIVTVLHDKLGLPLEAAQGLVEQLSVLAITYILGQSASDAMAIYKGSKTN